jgi:hypothetical protein
MRRQAAIGELDAPTIEERAAVGDSDQHGGVGVFGDADSRGLV